MPFKIIRNDIVKMNTEAIVNTANGQAAVGDGCDRAVYTAAGYDTLLRYRKEHIGIAEEGSVFLTPGFELPAKYIIHAVSPCYRDGDSGEEEKLRSCYRKSLALAKETGIRSIAFPLISTGSFGYPKEEGMRIAVDEIHAFLLENDMEIYLVVFDAGATELGKRIYPGLESYIDRHYVEDKRGEEYRVGSSQSSVLVEEARSSYAPMRSKPEGQSGEDRSRVLPTMFSAVSQSLAPPVQARMAMRKPDPPEESKQNSEQGNRKPKLFKSMILGSARQPAQEQNAKQNSEPSEESREKSEPFEAYKRKPEPSATVRQSYATMDEAAYEDAYEAPYAAADQEIDFEALQSKLDERIRHRSDTFSEYLLYLIREKGLDHVDVYKRAIVDKKIFSKLKNNPNYRPQKMTALCLCMGAKLSLDETRDLLARAGFALSPCDMTDIIFSYFIENGIYDMIELDIQLEEHGLPCIIA